MGHAPGIVMHQVGAQRSQGGVPLDHRALVTSSIINHPDPARGASFLKRVRRYWDIEGGLHQRLDVSGGEDSSRVRNRNAILVLGILRRSVAGIDYRWKSGRKNLGQSSFKDFHDAMNKFNHRLASATIIAHRA